MVPEHFAPFAMLILLAGLRSLPSEPFESAMMDGASRWQSFWHITVPLLQPMLVVVLIFRTIDSLKVFDIIWVITAGGPGFSSERVVEAIDTIVETYRAQRTGVDEPFLQTFRRVGMAPFKEALYERNAGSDI